MLPIDRRFRGLASTPAAWPLVTLLLLVAAASAAGASTVQVNAQVAVGEGAPLDTNAGDLGLPLPGDTTLGVPLVDEALPAQTLERHLRSPEGAAGGAWAGTPLESPAVQTVAGAGAVATLAGLAYALAGRGLLLPFLAPFYARLEKGALLNHPVRRELMKFIAEDPGVNVSDLHARFDLGWGSLLYHLQRLEAQGLVVSHRWGRSRRYFLNNRGVETRAEGIRALKAQNARVLAEVIAARPGRTQEELAQELNLSKSVISKYAKRLADASLVQREVGRNCLRLFPTSELRELLHTAAPLRVQAAPQARPAVPEHVVAPVLPSPNNAGTRHDEHGPQVPATIGA